MNGRSGFTLVEVLVGFLIMSLAAAATAVTMRSAAEHIGSNALSVEAMALSQEAMEDLRARRYEDISSGASGDSRFSVVWDVVADDPEPGMKSVAVTTSWTWRGEPRSYVLKTVYSKLTRR